VDSEKASNSCSAAGDYYTGGLVGEISGGTISNCYSTSEVEGLTGGSDNIGGLVGWNDGGAVSNCYAVGSVQGDLYIGGLVGLHSTGSYADCFWDSDVNPDVNGIGNIPDPPDVIGESTTNMKKESTFTDASWDFVEIWNIGENQTYPYLRVYPAGDLNHDGRVDFFDFAIAASHWLEGAGQ